MCIKKTGTIVFALLCILVSANIHAEPVPRWVLKGVGELDKARSNDSYGFHIFHTYDPDEKIVELDRFKPLVEYMSGTYGIAKDNVNIEILQKDEEDKPTVYELSFMRDGRLSVAYARLVDDFIKFDDYADGSFEYNLYQLYAISALDVTPEFDDFRLTDRYDGIPVALSVVPGLGQVYKGRKAKGFAIMGGEALLLTGVVVSAFNIDRYDGLAEQRPQYYDSYKSKAASYRTFGTVCAVAGAGLYVYNILDAAFSKGVRYVKVSPAKSSGVELSFEPVVTGDAAGFGVRLRF